jgi:hypothetical protein
MDLSPNAQGGVTARLIFPTPSVDGGSAPRTGIKRNQNAA